MKLSERPMEITDRAFRFDSFKDGSVVYGKSAEDFLLWDGTAGMHSESEIPRR